MKIEQPPEGYWREIYDLESQIHERVEKVRAHLLDYNAKDRWTMPSALDTEPGLDNEITFAVWQARRVPGLSFGSVAVNQVLRPDIVLASGKPSIEPAMQSIYGYLITPWFLGRPILKVHRTGISDVHTDTDEAVLKRQQGWKEARKMGYLRPTEEDYEQFKLVMQIGALGERRY